ncbi:MAG: CusA/CzcA family heavy metal efflux RND transporter [Polyangiales bacterium]
MLDTIVRTSIRHRVVVLALAALVLLGGVFALRRLPIDAVPDLTNVQVQVLTDSPGLSAEEIERFITRPVEMGLNGLPGLREIRSTTREGISAVTVIFHDGTDVWFARQLVMERLRGVEADIPPQFGRPEMAPVSTGLGVIYQFVVRGEGHSPMALRELLDWEITPALRSVPGIIEVNAYGGAKKQFHVVVDPDRLAAHRVTLAQVMDALSRNNVNVGGGYIERGAEQFVIRGESQYRGVDDVRAVVVTVGQGGTPVLVRHLAEVREGAALPQGVVTQNGEREVVLGQALMLAGQNSRDVVTAVHARMAEIRRGLPRGVSIEVVYDRKEFIDRTLHTVAKNLLEGASLVAIVLLVFLGSFRGSLLVTLGIPFAMSLTLFGMLAANITGNLMSLGAIDFGFLVDGPIVMLEACIARLALHGITPQNARASVAGAVRGVTRPVVFSVAIILLVYLPLLSLQDVEGKMFRPMAATMAMALGGSLVFALMVFPAAAVTFLKPPKEAGHHGLLHRLTEPYRRGVRLAVRHRAPLLAGAISLLLGVLPVAASLGADFVPRIDEGDIVVAIRRLPSIGISEARRLDLAAGRVLQRFPEVRSAIAITGRAELATDPVGMDSTDILVHLRPRGEWRTAHNLDDLGQAIQQAIEAEVPSTFASVSQPIEDKTNEMLSGSRADLVIYLSGPDLQVMNDLCQRVARVVRGIPGAGVVRVERNLGLPMLNVRVDRERLARYGIAAEDALAAVQASHQGRSVGSLFEGPRRYDLRVLLPPAERRADALGRLLVGSRDGQLIPLAQVADLVEQDGVAQIGREALQRRMRVEVNLRGRDLISFVADARAAVEREVQLPSGYRFAWGGQFENFERAKQRLAFVVPVALVIILGMLVLMFGQIRWALAVFTGVPFALVGGIVALKLRGLTFSLPAAVGFIALCGIAVLNGVVMATAIRKRLDAGEELEPGIANGAAEVLQALLLTATVAALGFAPMALSDSAGSEVQRPLATVVIGGLTSSTLLGLFLLPALLRIFRVRRVEERPPEDLG